MGTRGSCWVSEAEGREGRTRQAGGHAGRARRGAPQQVHHQRRPTVFDSCDGSQDVAAVSGGPVCCASRWMVGVMVWVCVSLGVVGSGVGSHRSLTPWCAQPTGTFESPGSCGTKKGAIETFDEKQKTVHLSVMCGPFTLRDEGGSQTGAEGDVQAAGDDCLGKVGV